MKLVKHFLEFDGYSRREISQIINLALKFKKQGYPVNKPLRNKVAALIFQKPSTRTRVSFEGGLARLGGYALYLGWQELQLGRGESVADTARVMSRYVNCLIARVYSHETLVEMADNSRVPVINALSDKHHPCQALADVMTVWEFSRKLKLKNAKIAYVGDGNNVCNSLIQICALLGMRLSVATPREYRPDAEIVKKALEWADKTGAVIEILEDPVEAVRDADFVYTDVFISMGQEEERQRRIETFLPRYQVNRELLSYAKPHVRFMHCMPMHVGEEVTADVAYSDFSIIYDQAENRMHTEAALLLHLLKDRR